MGWTVHHKYNSPRTHAEERAEIDRLFVPTKPAFDRGVRYTILQASKVGSVWYVAARLEGAPELAAPYIPAPDGSFVFAAVILTSCKGGEWGYKDMTEVMGPNESKAPLSLLDRLSPLDDSDRATHARAWRARCRTYAARIKPRQGDVLRLAEPVSIGGVTVDRVTVTSYTSRGKARTCYTAPGVGLFRLRPDHLIGAERV